MRVCDELVNGLDMGSWQPPTIVEQRDSSTEYDLLELTQAVFSLPARYYTEYHLWLQVGMALHSTDPGLLCLWERFSQQSLTDYRPGVCEQKWASFGDHDGPRLTAGSIFHWARESASIERPRFQGWGFQDFLKADFHADYLVDGVLVEGEPCIVGGPQKALKTLNGLDLAEGLATGSYFLTPDYPCLQRRVAFFSGESAPGTLQERAIAIAKSKGVMPTNEQLQIFRTVPRFDQPLDELKKLLIDNGTQVLFIDPAYMAMDGSEAGNAFGMYQQLGAMSSLCAELRITFLLAHHVTKSSGREHSPLNLYDLAWSGFAEWARQWLLLSRRSPFRHDGKHKLYLVAGGSAGHDKLLHVDVDEGTYPNRYWKVDVQSHSEASAGASDQRYSALVEAVRTLPADTWPLAKSPLADVLGVAHERWHEPFERMLADGVIEPIAGCTAGANRARYQLKTETEETNQ